jgi:hypothetical protein
MINNVQTAVATVDIIDSNGVRNVTQMSLATISPSITAMKAYVYVSGGTTNNNYPSFTATASAKAYGEYAVLGVDRYDVDAGVWMCK